MSINLDSYVLQLQERISALENVINEMGLEVRASKKNRFPRKTQSVTMYGMSRALCVETIDPLGEGRVRFYHPILHHPETPIQSLPFAKATSPLGGFDDCGAVWVPPAGSTLCILFENGDRDLPYYIGTTWHRNRGEGGNQFGFPIKEFFDIYAGHRKGYYNGPDDESQVLPQWSTENYNKKDYDSITEFIKNVDDQQRATYPNIYGFKTPEKHMIKLVDGDAKCNRRNKRFELLSGCGAWFCMKDDHLHFGGQYAHPDCTEDDGEDISLCAQSDADSPYLTDFLGQPIEIDDDCGDPILGGHPSTPDLFPGSDNDPTSDKKNTKYANNQKGSNPYFKHKNECRPYRGPQTPQNNKCDLPQSGVQLLSISGHTMVMDDSVEEPRGKPTWERSMEAFDFGCNDKYLGRFYIKSATGHKFEMSDVEEDTSLRGENNYIELRSASGNFIQLNDHTVGNSEGSCPPNYAGEKRGVHIGSTSKHEINLVDEENQQCSPDRKEGGVPDNNATKAYINIKSGFGSEIRLDDSGSQKETQNQWIQITNPQCSDPVTDESCNPRGPHFLRFQARPGDQPGVIFLRAGGHSVRQTYDKDVVLVGDKEKNPSDKFTYVSRMNIQATEKVDFRYAGDLHVMMAENKILLMAGRDCPPKKGKKCRGPCVYPVVVGRCPISCPITGITHWTEKSLSERVFASAYNSNLCSGGDGHTTEGQPPPCTEDDQNESIDTGAGVVNVGGVDSSNQGGSTPGQ